LSFTQPHPRPFPVLVDENHAGGFEGGADLREVENPRLALAALITGDSIGLAYADPCADSRVHDQPRELRRSANRPENIPNLFRASPALADGGAFRIFGHCTILAADMARSGSQTLSDLARPRLEVTCEKCGRRGSTFRG